MAAGVSEHSASVINQVSDVKQLQSTHRKFQHMSQKAACSVIPLSAIPKAVSLSLTWQQSSQPFLLIRALPDAPPGDARRVLVQAVPAPHGQGVCAALVQTQCHHTAVNYRSDTLCWKWACSCLLLPPVWHLARSMGPEEAFPVNFTLCQYWTRQFLAIQFLFLNSFSAHSKKQEAHMSGRIFLVRSSRLKELSE